ncbi:MAG: cation-transporting P-type ATPase [Patescibacteria group bacterium]
MPPKGYEGLTGLEAEQNLQKYGHNLLAENKKSSPLLILFRQVKNNFLIYLLLTAAVLSFFIGEPITGWTIFGVVLIIVVTAFIQEYRAEKAIEALKGMILPESIVIRDGKEQRIASSEIVPGDVLVLRAGDKIAADGQILEENELRVNESILTGESIEVRKTVSSDESNKNGRIFMGTFVVNGKCTIKVTHTGMNTEFGKIAGMVTGTVKDLPLQAKINKIVRYMGFVAVTAAITVGIISLLRGDVITSDTIIGTITIVIALSVSAFPEGLPLVLTSTLASGSYRMARKNAIVNRMSAIETLGETTVICSDKTGTITMGEMTVKKIFADEQIFEVTGGGFGKDGLIKFKNEAVTIKSHHSLDKLVKASVICNDAIIEDLRREDRFRVIGTPTEASLLVMAAKAGVCKEDVNFQRIEELPFNSTRKTMAVVVQEDEDRVAYLKGALEYLVNNCDKILKNGKICNLTKEEKERIFAVNNDMTSRGFRTIAFSFKNITEKGIVDFENDYVFIGIVGIDDPAREEAGEAIKKCATAGIKVKMITGDNKETALAIAREVGIQGEVLEGSEIDEMSDSELSNIVKEINIFARVNPGHKLRIVKVMKDNGEIITMTGDGVNDAPALKEAHIGVAMGKNGTDVTREVADITLKDDNFATIVEAISEGRTIFANIRKFTAYQLSCNFSEIVLLVVAMIVGLPLPLIALQILFVNLVTDDLPAISLGFNAPSKDVMKVGPRRNSQILDKNLIALIVIIGGFMGLLTLFVFHYTYNILAMELSEARTITLLLLIFFEVVGAFGFRSLRSGVLEMPFFSNKYLVIASAISLLSTIIIVYTGANEIFGTSSISLIFWPILFTFSFFILFILDLLKLFSRRTKTFLSGVH